MVSTPPCVPFCYVAFSMLNLRFVEAIINYLPEFLSGTGTSQPNAETKLFPSDISTVTLDYHAFDHLFLSLNCKGNQTIKNKYESPATVICTHKRLEVSTTKINSKL